MRIGTRKGVVVVAALLIAAIAIFIGGRFLFRPGKGAAEAVNTGTAQFVGSESCAGCHAVQYAQWQGSNHHHAMEPANEHTVLGDFNDVAFTYFGRKTRFSRNGDHFQVRTEDERGVTGAFTVAYTLGHAPLQQYLVELPGGRIQALPFAWDTRARAEGGQHWFHLYPKDDVRPDNPLFWTRPQQNWNHMCGECHTTNFSKGFLDADNRFASSWSELGDGCESCHGAGSVHVAAMHNPSASKTQRAINGLHGQPAQIDQCGACHARRVRLTEDPSHERILQTWRPELILDGLYFVDGQIHDEVFEVGSFLQSTMAAKGVTCADCHNPHTAELKAQGNGLCTECHDADTYDTERHHFHQVGTRGSECVDCHMPTRTYMVVDARRDHRLAIPRPDLSDALGTPNPCVACHQGKSNAWAAETIHRQVAARQAAPALPETFGVAFWQSRNEQMAAAASLRGQVNNQAVNPIVRATALMEMGKYVTPDAMGAIQSQLSAADPLVRLGAVQALNNGVPAPQRLPLLMSHVQDESRAVRLTIAPLLAGADRVALTIAERQQIEKLFAEYRQWLSENGDRAEALVALAGFDLAEGDATSAQVSFEKALRRDETSLVAYLNYADYYRGVNNDPEAEKLLRKAGLLYPDSATVHFSLGLLLVRQKHAAEAAPELQRAAALAPGNSYYVYAYAVNLYSTGRIQQALSVLTDARARFPANELIQTAQRSYCAEQRGKSRPAGLCP